MLNKAVIALVVSVAVQPSAWSSVAFADDNKKNLEIIMDNVLLGKNKFRVEDKETNTRYLNVTIGAASFHVGVHKDTAHQMLDCYFDWQHKDLKSEPIKTLKEVTYTDVGCIGELYKVSEDNALRDPTDADMRAYRDKVLLAMATLMPSPKAFSANIPPSKPGAPLDAALRANNKALLDKIISELHQSLLTENDTDFSIFNLFGTGGIRLQLLVAKDRSMCDLNQAMPGDDIMMFMKECAGRIDSFKLDRGKEQQADSAALDPVLNVILIDLERFTRFATDIFPKTP